MKSALLLSLIFSLLFSPHGFAQNAEIIKAPAAIKIDGKLTEFADSLANYDKTTKIYYTIANDANNLYIFIKANGRQEQNKIMAGGITVAINPKGKKKAVSSITFPVIDRTAMMAEMRNRGGQARNGQIGGEMRKKMLSQLKEIKISGLPDLLVESISIYNTYGLKTGINYNDKGALIYELAIPLKLVNITDEGKEIAINIRLNGLEIPENPNGGYNVRGPGGGNFDGGRIFNGGNLDASALFKLTEFWIKAKLAQ